MKWIEIYDVLGHATHEWLPSVFHHVGIDGVAVSEWLLLLSSLIKSFSLFLSLFVYFWLSDIRHLGVDIEKCVCTSALLSSQPESKTHVHTSAPNIMAQHTLSKFDIVP